MSSEMELPQPPPTNVQRIKLIWRILLISNLALGAYMFSRKKDKQLETAKTTKELTSAEPVKATVEVHPTQVEDEEPFFLPVFEPVKVQKEPIPVEQQRELFQWLLEEKRKIKPMDREEKKRIDEEKARLKQFIRAESIPDL
ncbi:hypothetical protein RJ641_026759 [Dillenia turbinata]|uniref:Transmembrane protein n=1 Tax=Dillenia turbinata TaxID=194707 RepID=A0AAN8W8W9_9MAGN